MTNLEDSGSLSSEDVYRIAVAVCDEMERRQSRPPSVRFVPAHDLGAVGEIHDVHRLVVDNDDAPPRRREW